MILRSMSRRGTGTTQRMTSRYAAAALTASTTMLASHAALGQETLRAAGITRGLNRPNAAVAMPGDASAVYVVEQTGQVRRAQTESPQTSLFLDISDRADPGTSGETGLLGLAFAPDFELSGRLFVYYTETVRIDESNQIRSVLAEFRASGQPGTDQLVDPQTERRILTIDQPFSNHNGGWIAFGPDGYLYIASGDGGSGNDPGDEARDLLSLLGKMLRIDVRDDSVPYLVPDTNPFAFVDNAQPEIWAYGLRNPFRNSFDLETGDLWIADVGQGEREEVNWQLASSAGGEHYGWRCREGNIPTPGITDCPDDNPNWVEPTLVYRHASGRCSITGGYVYRGCALGQSKVGRYFYADFCTGEIFSYDPLTMTRRREFSLGFGVTSFGQGPDGELYITTLGGDLLGIEAFSFTDIDDANADGIADTCECPAEYNNDGFLDAGDIQAFINDYLDTQPGADLNNDGFFDAGDIQAFVTAFLTSCG